MHVYVDGVYARSCHVSPLRVRTPGSVPPHSNGRFSSLSDDAGRLDSNSRIPGSSRTTLDMTVEKGGWCEAKRPNSGGEPYAMMAVSIRL